jgi:peptidoglycan hydrolase CwlO-like protein
MAKKTITPEYVTREILKEEISASEQRLGTKIAGLDVKVDNVENRLDAKIDNVEKRLDAKIETTAQSLKDYTDSRFTLLDAKLGDVGSKVNGLDAKLGDVNSKVNGLDAKLTKYFELMMQTFTEGNKGIHKILSNHEERITVLEGKGADPGRT